VDLENPASIIMNRPAKEVYALRSTENTMIKLYEASPEQLNADSMLILYCNPLDEIYSNDAIKLPSCLCSAATEYNAQQ
jgi:hypothetical protein